MNTLGVVIGGNEQFRLLQEPDYMDLLKQIRPDIVYIDISANDGIMAKKLLPMLTELNVAPCYRVNAENPHFLIDKFVESQYPTDNTMFVVASSLRFHQEKVDVLLEQVKRLFPGELRNIAKLFVTASVKHFKEDSLARSFYNGLCKISPNVTPVYLVNNSSASLKPFETFENESLAVMVTSKSYTKIFSKPRNIFFWSFDAFLSIPKKYQRVKTEPKKAPGTWEVQNITEKSLSVRDNMNLQAGIIGKVQPGATIVLINSEIQGALIWGITPDRTYVLLEENNTPYYRRIL